MVIKLKIANITLAYTYHFSEYLDSRINAYKLSDSEKVDYHMEVILSSDIKPYDVMYEHKDNEAIYTSAELDVTTYYMQDKIEIVEQLVFDKLSKKVLIYINPNRVQDLPMQEYILSGMMFMEIALYEGYLALHASAISYHGKALLFAAPSTTGKSTHARMWKELYLDDVQFINDDKPLIFNHKGKLHVAGSPFSGKKVLNQNIIQPLKAIIFLSQGKIDELIKLDEQIAIKEIITNILRPKEELTWDIVFKTITQITKQVPIFHLNATKSYDAVRLVQRSLYQEDHHDS